MTTPTVASKIIVIFAYVLCTVRFRAFGLGFRVQVLGNGVQGQADTTKGLPFSSHTTPETTQGQKDGFFSQLPFKYYLPEVAYVGD